ncbi:MAG: hypothetical protein QOJ52_2462 [Acidimicrobiaceae bacterium]|nr:hypothetical protein [Acidimicrobiaceae bacterium]
MNRSVRGHLLFLILSWSRAFGFGFAGDRLLAAPVAFAVEDEFVGRRLKPVDSGLREERVGHEAEPFDRFPVGGHDGGGFLGLPA